jgi:hypothetical protein
MRGPVRWVIGRAQGWLRPFFWMDERVATARRTDFNRLTPGWRHFELGLACMADADELEAKGGAPGSSIVLYRTATALLLTAHRARAGVDVGSDTTEDASWASLGGISTIASVLDATPAGELRTVREVLQVPRVEGKLIALSDEERRQAADDLRDFASRLRQSLTPYVHRYRRAMLTRWMRILLGCIAVATGLIVLVRKAVGPPRNLALHCPVVVETLHPVYGQTPGAVVDGDRTHLGFHSIDAPNQTLTIDLGDTYRVSEVVVYNRTDCCRERAVPLKIELGIEPGSFQQVAIRSDPFDLWRADFRPQRARYVRLTDLNSSAFHLNEVEVY